MATCSCSYTPAPPWLPGVAPSVAVIAASPELKEANVTDTPFPRYSDHLHLQLDAGSAVAARVTQTKTIPDEARGHLRGLDFIDAPPPRRAFRPGGW